MPTFTLCPVSCCLNLHPFLSRIRPANGIQNGGDALRPNAPDTLELAGGGGATQAGGVGRSEVAVDARSDRRAESGYIKFEQRPLLWRQLIAKILVKH